MESTATIEHKREESSKPLSPALSRVHDSRFRGTAADCAVLAAAILQPVLLNVRHLGFYADDWGNIGRFLSHHDTTVSDYFHRLYALPGTRGRPVMDLYLAVLYRAFGVHYLGYHIVNTFVLFASAVLFYLSLRLVVRQRFVALTVPLIFVLLPNYSSARIVPCSFMSGLSLAFYFLNLYGLLKASSQATPSTPWACISVAAILVSGLSYEILLPLFALNLMLLFYLQAKKPGNERLRVRSRVLLLAMNVLALLSVAVFKVSTVTRLHEIVSVQYVVTQAFLVQFYKLGLRLPIVTAKIILVYRNPSLEALASIFGLLVFWYSFALQRTTGNAGTNPKLGLRLLAFGGLVFTFALTIFVVTHGTTGFTATGFENRTAMGCSLGMAFIFSGFSSWLGCLVKVHRALLVSLLLAFLCIAELLAAGTIGSFWAEAGEQQERVLSSIHNDIPIMPPKTVLLLDGVCPYVGPGITFEGHQDMGGALQAIYQDPTLRGDVVTPRLLVHDDSIETSIYGRYRFYPYGNLRVYDFRRRRAWDLPNVQAALAYFGRLGPAHTFCAEGNEGDGVPIF